MMTQHAVSVEPQPYALCPCGSGQKYKFCCAKKEQIPFDLWAANDPNIAMRSLWADIAAGEKAVNEQ